MGLLDKLFGKKDSALVLSEEEIKEAGVCPNCWGHGAYADQFVDFAKDQTKANIIHDKTKRKAFVQQFVETHVTGIKLNKSANGLVCPKCQTKHI